MRHKLLDIILFLHVFFTGFIILDFFNLTVPIVKPLIVSIYLLFLPGFMMIIIFKMKNKNIIETILYSIGLSIFVLMFMGMFMNIVYPFFRVMEPLTPPLVKITLIFLTSFLYILCYIRGADHIHFNAEEVKQIINPSLQTYILAFILIPFLAIFGGYFVQVYDNNILLFILLVLISVIPLFVSFEKIPKETYPLLIFMIALSLLYHNTLSSMYIQGSDLHVEYYFANLVLSNSYWDASFSHKFNTSLSVVIFPVIFSIISGISLTWVFKAIYPLIFSIVPLTLYLVYKEQTNEKIAFLSCFYMVSIMAFYTEMIQLAKQMIAEFFLSLLILMMGSKQMDTARRGLLVIFALSMIVSYYGLSYVFLSLVFFVCVLALLSRKKMGKFDVKLANHIFAALFATSTLSWYLYTSGSCAFESAIKIINHAIESISELFSPTIGGSVYWITRKLSFTEEVLRLLYIVSVLLMIIGFAKVIFQSLNEKRSIFSSEYVLFSAASIVWLAVVTVVPALAGSGSLGFTRVFHIFSLFLAPFVIIGGMYIENIPLTHYKCRSLKTGNKKLKYVSIFLVIFMLFNSSFVSEVIQETIGGDHAISPSLSQPRIKRNGSIEEKMAYYSFNYPEQDVRSAIWLGSYKPITTKVFVDAGASARILFSYGKIKPAYYVKESECLFILPKEDVVQSTNGSYIYLRRLNYVDGIMRIDFWIEEKYGWWNTSEVLLKIENNKNRIYDNGGSVVYI